MILEMILSSFMILLPPAAFAWCNSRSIERQEYLSPDRALCAIVLGIGSGSTKNAESLVEIRKANDALVISRNYSSTDAQHGESVVRAQWTPDSRFFVYSMTSSGGHQPWNWPTDFYSRHGNKIMTVQDLLHDNPTLTANFRIIAPHSLRTITWRKPGLRNEDEVTVTVDLLSGRITQETAVPGSAERSDTAQ